MNNADEAIPDVHALTTEPLKSRLLRRVGGDIDLASDILQDAWLRALVNWRKAGVPDRPGAWLAVVARNLLSNTRRDRRRVFVRDAEVLNSVPDESRSADPVRAMELAECRAEIRAAMSRLSSAESALLTSFHVDGRSVDHLAASLGLTNKAVEGRLRRVRRKLRRELAGSYADRFAISLLALADPGDAQSGLALFLRRLPLAAMTPFVFVLAFAPLAFAVDRLPRRSLAWLRVTAGVLLFVIATIAAPDAARESYVRTLQLMSVGLVFWGLWMLRAPSLRPQ